MLDEERRGFEEGLTRKRRERIEGIRVAKKKKKRKKERKRKKEKTKRKFNSI